jgi:hypothetical protein
MSSPCTLANSAEILDFQKSIIVTLEAQFIFQKHTAQLCTSSIPTKILPGNGLEQPTVLITSSKVAALQTVHQQLNTTDITQAVDLLEDIFTSGIAEKVHTLVFNNSWKNTPVSCTSGVYF